MAFELEDRPPLTCTVRVPRFWTVKDLVTQVSGRSGDVLVDADNGIMPSTMSMYAFEMFGMCGIRWCLGPNPKIK